VGVPTQHRVQAERPVGHLGVHHPLRDDGEISVDGDVELFGLRHAAPPNSMPGVSFARCTAWRTPDSVMPSSSAISACFSPYLRASSMNRGLLTLRASCCRRIESSMSTMYGRASSWSTGPGLPNWVACTA